MKELKHYKDQELMDMTQEELDSLENQFWKERQRIKIMIDFKKEFDPLNPKR